MLALRDELIEIGHDPYPPTGSANGLSMVQQIAVRRRQAGAAVINDEVFGACETRDLPGQGCAVGATVEVFPIR
jgi:hypothetical protein